ncbi:MAG TPA: alpha/beta fold hydrolase [Planctomycetota bacterium]|nr:alpha/beta fold hydrolase [Planctomycetota bacterium]
MTDGGWSVVVMLTVLVFAPPLWTEETAVKEDAGSAWEKIATFFKPPEKYANDFGAYRSPLLFDDGTPVKTSDDWQRRRKEILKTWHDLMGPWPELIENPALDVVETEHLETFTRKTVHVEVRPERKIKGYLLVPDGEGPFPAVLVVFYGPETGAGIGEPSRCDFGYRLTQRGFVTLSIGWPAYNPRDLQPLSYLAYAAANCHTALAALPEVDGKRIGVVGHSFGGKWAMFASCLDERFACAVWCDPGIVWNEKDPNANYWEPWYLGHDPDHPKRKPGIPTAENPRTGPYAVMVETGRDLHELHALMAPRPFLVSGGAQDRPEHWTALNHAIAVNRMLGFENRVAMTMRDGHSPTDESTAQLYAFFEHFLKPTARP